MTNNALRILDSRQQIRLCDKKGKEKEGFRNNKRLRYCCDQKWQRSGWIMEL